MTGWLRAARAGVRAEAIHLRRSPLLVVLSVIQAVTFLLLVSLFGITGSQAPTGLVDLDGSTLSGDFATELSAAHHSFALRPMPAADAHAALQRGDLVAVITIPQGFGRMVSQGDTVPVVVDVDNVDADLTDDVQRALPSAIQSFAVHHGFGGIRVRPAELDLIAHDTGYIPYLVVSALALDALVVAGILAGIAVAREYESRTALVLATTPRGMAAPLFGRVVVTAAASFAAMLLTVAVVVLGFGVRPEHPLEMVGALAGCVVVSSFLGAAVGALVRRTLPVASLVFGLALPLYIDSGSLEPERFDGDVIWIIAHASPVYYGVGLLEHAVHGLSVTPESIVVDALALAGWGVFIGGLAWLGLRRVPAAR